MKGHYQDVMPKKEYLEMKRRQDEEFVRSLAVQAAEGGKSVPVAPFVDQLRRFLLYHGLTRKVLKGLLPPKAFPTVDAASEFVFRTALPASHERLRECLAALKKRHPALSPNIVRAANELLSSPRNHRFANVPAFFAGEAMPRDELESTLTGVLGGAPSHFRELMGIMPTPLDWSTFWPTVHAASMFVQPFPPPPAPKASKPARKARR